MENDKQNLNLAIAVTIGLILMIAWFYLANPLTLRNRPGSQSDIASSTNDTPIINSTSTEFLLSRHPNELSGETNTTVYDCENGKMFIARVEVKPRGGGKAEVFLTDGTKMLLNQTLSGSGVRYANSGESFIFWTKGDTAFIEEGNVYPYSNCTARQ